MSEANGKELTEGEDYRVANLDVGYYLLEFTPPLTATAMPVRGVFNGAKTKENDDANNKYTKRKRAD